MARVMNQAGQNVTPKGQPSRNTCWLTAYEMLFNGAGYSSINQSNIEQMLTDGGFNDLATTKAAGLLDTDMPKAADALGLGTTQTSALLTIGGIARCLQQYGVLWTALQIPNPDDPTDRFHHIVVVVGVDEENGYVGLVNPWKYNYYDIPGVGWLSFKDWFYPSVKYTQHETAGLQYVRYN